MQSPSVHVLISNGVVERGGAHNKEKQKAIRNDFRNNVRPIPADFSTKYFAQGSNDFFDSRFPPGPSGAKGGCGGAVQVIYFISRFPPGPPGAKRGCGEAMLGTGVERREEGTE